MTDRRDNVEFISDLMSFGNPLKQAVILEAIRRYAIDVADMDLEAAEASGKWNWISAPAWKACGEEIRDAFIERGLIDKPEIEETSDGSS